MKDPLKKRERIIYGLVLKIILRFLSFRFYKIVLSTSAKKKQLEVLHQKTAHNIHKTMFLLEGVFVKVGQLIATMSSFLPNVYADTLEDTQGDFKSKKFKIIKKSIEQELKCSISNVFTHVEEQALGVATIGQVHKAILLNGDRVVVKIQHHNIEALAKMDLQILKKVLKYVKYFISLKGFENVFSEVEQMILSELDYKKEALQLIEFKDNFKNDTSIKVPKVYKDISTEKLLVLEYVEGVKITNIKGETKKQLAEKMIHVFSKSVFKYGLYHADPHPGNVLVNNKGQLVFIDFGAVGRFKDVMREGLILLFEAIILKDENLLLAGLHKMKFIKSCKGNNDIYKFFFRNLILIVEQEFDIPILEMYRMNLEEIDFIKIISILKSIDKQELEKIVNIPKEWIVLYRAITLTIGVSNSLAPNVKIYEIVKENLVLMFLDSKKLVFKNTIEQQITRLITLPRKLEVFMESVEEKALNTKVNIGRELILQQILYVIATAISYHFYLVTNQLLFVAFISISLFLLGICSFKRFKTN